MVHDSRVSFNVPGQTERRGRAIMAVMRYVNSCREDMLDANELNMVRARAEAAGLDLDEERLGLLVDSLRGFMTMMDAVEQVEIDPTDLALEPFDPAWPAGDRAS